MKIIIHGYTGRMGQMLVSLSERENSAFEVAAKVSPDCPLETGICYTKLDHFTGEADCIIDFSNHAAAKTLTDYAVKRGIPLVVATTGHTESEFETIKHAAEHVPVFFSANMSVGVALLASLAKEAASAFPDADIEIIETHHNQKLDVPSGTALLLARKIKEARGGAEILIGRRENGKRGKEIGIHSVRLGNETGKHTIIISAGSETITLEHKAENRILFAEGAVAAAKFICGKKAGFYTMEGIVK